MVNFLHTLYISVVFPTKILVSSYVLCMMFASCVIEYSASIIITVLLCLGNNAYYESIC